MPWPPSPSFARSLRARRRFVVPATIFFIAFYLALPLSVGFAPQLMSRAVIGPLTLAYCFALVAIRDGLDPAGALPLARARASIWTAARIRHHETHEIEA